MRDIKAYKEQKIAELREKIGGVSAPDSKKALLGLSGGVDSSVCCALLAQAIGKRLFCIFVDHGLMRKNEGDEVEAAFGNMDINFIRVDAGARFLGKLAGITEPEQKRKIIGEEFIRVFEEEAKKLGEIDFLAQGTISLDVIESKGAIKAHHNVGGLPDSMNFKEIIEPLKELNKEEVRELGRELGLPAPLTDRQPFPGPGLAVRCIGELTKERLDILREADYIFRSELTGAGIDKDVSQCFAALTDMKAVGIKDGKRTYGYIAVLRAVRTTDFMNAEVVRIPYEVLEKVSAKITSVVDGISRVVYDITDKPPGTIELE
jgi:GMP synthase (glutamine-hydrolysing)